MRQRDILRFLPFLVAFVLSQVVQAESGTAFPKYDKNRVPWVNFKQLPPVPYANGEGSDPFWKRTTRKIVAKDKLPNLSRSDVASLVGKRLAGLKCDGGFVVPPMFYSIVAIDTEHAFAITYGTKKKPGGLVFVDIPRGRITPAKIGKKPIEDWISYSYYNFQSISDERSIWLLAPSKKDAQLMQLAIFDPVGKLLLYQEGLPRPTTGVGYFHSQGKTVYLNTKDKDGKEVVLLFDTSGKPLNLTVPAVTNLQRTTADSLWYDKQARHITPPSFQELAVPIGMLDSDAFDDPTLYLPLDDEGRPLPLPSNSFGLLRLVSYSNEKSAHTYTNMGEIVGLKPRYPNCHSGWAVVREDDQGIYYELASGSAQQTIEACSNGRSLRYRDFHPINGHKYACKDYDQRTKKHTYAPIPPRAVGRLMDGRYQIIDLQKVAVFQQQCIKGSNTANSEKDIMQIMGYTDSYIANTFIIKKHEEYIAYKKRAAEEARLNIEDARYRARKQAEEQARQKAAFEEEEKRELVNFAAYIEGASRLDARHYLSALNYNHKSLERLFYYKFGIQKRHELQLAVNVGMPDDWLAREAKPYLDSDARQAAYDALPPYTGGFSWENVFNAWHIQQKQKSRVEVIRDRNLIKVVTHD